ncbi:MAG: hypothetical protein R2847_10065 [Bacteroidia bacterium]
MILVKSIYNHDGSLVEEYSPVFTQVITEENAWLMPFTCCRNYSEPGGTSQALWGYNVFGNGNEIGVGKQALLPIILMHGIWASHMTL